MEPSITGNLNTILTLDLTPAQMVDVGRVQTEDGRFFACPIGSDDHASVHVNSCDTGVFNQLGPFGFSLGLMGRPNDNAYGIDTNGGCYIQDMINACTLQGSSGLVKSCIQHTTDYLLKAAVMSKRQAKRINDCAR
jgi:hypothetical protein